MIIPLSKKAVSVLRAILGLAEVIYIYLIIIFHHFNPLKAV